MGSGNSKLSVRTAADSRTGLEYWMQQVLRECERGEAGFHGDAVHDLRVALRRCRAIAEVMRRVDSHAGWRKIRKKGRSLARSLGALRDTQVMIGWVKRLGSKGDPVRQRMLLLLREREGHERSSALHSIQQLDRKAWKKWAQRLAQRAGGLPPGGLIFQQVAREHWHEAQALDAQARHSRSRVGWHRLRIGVKKFRYAVENFLPKRAAEMGAELKKVQDLLGEVHDLNVLLSTLRKTKKLFRTRDQVRWQNRIHRERQERLRTYKAITRGATSVWMRWKVWEDTGPQSN